MNAEGLGLYRARRKDTMEIYELLWRVFTDFFSILLFPC
jgi:hypothetical protein